MYVENMLEKDKLRKEKSELEDKKNACCHYGKNKKKDKYKNEANAVNILRYGNNHSHSI